MTMSHPPTLASSDLRRNVLHRLVPDHLRPRLTELYRPLRYRGSGVLCPVCEHEFRRFMDHRGQPSVRCPMCGSMERHRLLWMWLRADSDFFTAPRRMLHFAPEYGVRKRLRRQANLDYRTADLQSRLAKEHFDITDIPLPDDSFDTIFCNHVLEHVPDDERAMAELHRILCPGGWAVLMTPVGRDVERTIEEDIADPAERLACYGQEDHVRLYGHDFYERLARAGFDVDVIDYDAELSDADIERHRLRRRHQVFEDDKVVIGRKSASP
jgi:predicted SAM-dependent methyltransferase